MELSRLIRRLAPTALIAATIVVTAAWGPGATGPSYRTSNTPDARTIEFGWVRAHLDSVLSELLQRDLSALSSGQRVRRAALLRTLRMYRDGNDFPRNYDFPGQAVPYFTDRKTGTLCAVGYLLASTGRMDIVERVTRANNNVRVHELAGDTALDGWLDSNGLTLAEAARIQVVYAQSPSTGETVRQVAGLGLTPVALAGSLITGAWNALGNSDGHRVSASITGALSGVASIGLGAMLSGTQGVPRSSGIISAGVGGLSLALAVHSMMRHHDIVAAARETQRKNVIASATIVPLIQFGAGSGAGAMVSLKF